MTDTQLLVAEGSVLSLQIWFPTQVSLFGAVRVLASKELASLRRFSTEHGNKLGLESHTLSLLCPLSYTDKFFKVLSDRDSQFIQEHH